MLIAAYEAAVTQTVMEMVEEMLDERSLAYLNNGQGTRVDVNRSTVSCLGFTLVSGSLGYVVRSQCIW